jgi:SAM-dependent methyltransferase
MPADTCEPLLRATQCAICGTSGQASELYPANFALDAFRPDVFSARRLPDRLHYRLVRCHHCSLLRSDPVADDGTLAALYARSTFDYGTEVTALRQTYGRYLERARACTASSRRLLEIGCGNGFFLEQALDQGVEEVFGIEPSAAAIASASPRVRSHIVEDVLRTDQFPAESFDIVCLLQVLDHLPAPQESLAECWRLLRPGGVVLCLQHNERALSARLLGRRSPIIDIEHTYLYNPATLRRLFEQAGYEIVARGPVWNTYRLEYVLRLLPFPSPLKSAVLAAARTSRIGCLRVRVPLGNYYQVARRPLDS